jgi:hypothetical protein
MDKEICKEARDMHLLAASSPMFGLIWLKLSGGRAILRRRWSKLARQSTQALGSSEDSKSVVNLA